MPPQASLHETNGRVTSPPTFAGIATALWMDSINAVNIRAIALLCALYAASGFGQTTLILSDNYEVETTTTGFELNSGVNFGINPPATRLTGAAAPNLRYFNTYPEGRSASKFGINSGRLRVLDGTGVGRFTLTADGANPYDFSTALGTADATPSNPVIYEVRIRMRNDASGTQRVSFGLATVEGDVTILDFGVQLVHATTNDDFYTIYRRIDTNSAGVADVNLLTTTTAAGTYKSLNSILMRVTDAGAESGTNYNSRVQLSLNNGTTWIYDTWTDGALPNGWRLDGPGRYIIFDQAPNDANVFYDGFSITRLVTVSATLVSPPDKTVNAGPSVSLSASVSNALASNLDVTFYGREKPMPFAGTDFCIAVLPDTQNYAREAAGNGDAVKEMWFAQTDWIVANRVSQNIVYVAHLGDIVQNGDIKDGKANLTEWRNATNAMYRLENPATTGLPHGIPYGMAVGNHDQEPIGDEDGTTTHYTRYFGISHFSGRPYYGGYFSDNGDSHYDVFSASGLDFIVLYFEYGRYGSSILNWANNVLAAHPNHRAIAITHHMGSDKTPSSFSTQGSAIFNALKVNTNLFLLLGGHVAANGGEGSRSDTYLGRTIRTFISDFQGWLNGGNGFMRLMYFSPSNNLVTIKTYSPWLNEYRTDANSQMTFSYKMPLPTGPGSPGTPYVALSTNLNVTRGATTSCTWSELREKTTYDWYVRVVDQEGNAITTPPFTFATLSKFLPNQAPIANNQFIPSVIGDAPVPLALTGSDPDGDTITFEVLNEPLNGFLSDFNPDTGTFTYLPPRGFRGLDRVNFRVNDGLTNSTASSLTFKVDGPPDADGDGLPDQWEAFYGVSDADGDADIDGANNFAEYRANTNPTNALSAFRIVALEPTESGLEVQWSSVGGTRYRLQYADSATGGLAGPFTDIERSLTDEMDTAPYGEDSSQSWIDELPGEHARYYRIRIVP